MLKYKRVGDKKNAINGTHPSLGPIYLSDKYVAEMIDKEAKKIGLKFTNESSEEGARKIRFHEKIGGATIPAKSFTYMHGLAGDKRFNCHFEQKEEMLIASYA